MLLHKQILLSQELTDDTAAAEIVHRRIPLVALKVPGTVAPILRQNISLGIYLLDAAANFRPQLMGKLDFILSGKGIRHIKAPAIDAVGGLQPLLQHRILCPVDNITEVLGRVSTPNQP